MSYYTIVLYYSCMKTFRPLNLIIHDGVVCNSGHGKAFTGPRVVPQCKLLHTTLMNNEVQRSKSFHTAVVQYYSVLSLPYYILLVLGI